MMKKILITGGLGFIGSHVVEHFVTKYPEYNFFVVDKETYAANKEFLNELKTNPNYIGVKYYNYDICDYDKMRWVFSQGITDVIHLAAESHVDNSIDNPTEFINTNVLGTVNLLNIANIYWGSNLKNKRFYHISTDEVYGSIENLVDTFKETTPYDPKSPYSASKASSDHFVRAYGNTFKLPYVISNCSNNYGERQHSEKLIPKVINNILDGKKIPVYGNGSNIRDWLYVKDHVNAIDTIFHSGVNGETYNIGGDNELSNINLVKKIIRIMDINDPIKKHSEDLIEYVKDRKGHDFRYSIDHTKLTDNLGWKPVYTFSDAMIKTIQYYIDNKSDK